MKENMKINLRKANALQLSVQDAIKSIKFDTDVKVNEFQVAEDVIAKAREAFAANQERHRGLLNSLYDIRKAVSRANSAQGVDVKLADVALMDKKIQYLTDLAGKTVRESVEVVAGKMDKLRNRKEDTRNLYYGHDASVDTSIFTQEDIAGFRIALSMGKKAKQKLQDELLDINVRTEIDLGTDVVTVLTAEGLL
jgi:ssDNA-binding replication factor A large subunit